MTARLPSGALKAYYDADSETGQHLKAAGYTVVDWFYDAGRFSLLP